MAVSKNCKCGCGEQLEEDIKKDCDCSSDCKCGEDCTCDNGDKCFDECACEETKDCNNAEHKEYLTDLLRLQAEFDNYRKRMSTSLSDARQDGFIDAIVGFLPALDSFKMATSMITDKNTLMGIKFIEKGILDTLSKMGVNSIDASGKFNPELHQAVDTDSTSELEEGMIVKEVATGFTYKDKVIRYSQVIVKK